MSEKPVENVIEQGKMEGSDSSEEEVEDLHSASILSQVCTD
jgi:hypothetical protein